MPKTYEPIQEQTLTGTVNNVEFTSIPQTYTDLIIVSTPTQNTGYNQLNIQFNSDTGNYYSSTWLTGSNNTAFSGRVSNTSAAYLSSYAGPGTTAGNFVCISHIMNYSNSTTLKTVISRAGNPGTGTDVELTVGLWRSSSAITSLKIFLGTNSFVSGSRFVLYGIKAA